MLRHSVILLTMLVLPATLFGQSTLDFPREFSTTDLTATGFAFVNPGPTAATVNLTLLSTSGNTVAAASEAVPPGGQIALLGSQYFPNATTAGWVQATSATTGLRGFWIGGDFNTYVDGADGATPATDQVLPLVAGQTEIDIANPGSTAISVTISLAAANGGQPSPAVTENIAALGVFQGQASALFPNANLNQPAYIHISSPSAFVATSVVKNFLTALDTGVINGVNTSTALTQMYFPHAVSGPLNGLNYESVIAVTNLASTSQTVTLSFTSESGGAATSIQQTLQANGTLQESLAGLLNSSNFEDGWVQVTGTAAITGCIAYAETTGGGFAIVPVQTTPQTSMVLMQVADLPPWSTGIALLNATSTTANVEVFAIYPGGGLMGGPATSSTASFTIAPGTKIADQLVPQLIGTSANGGFIFVTTTNNVPLYGLELFLSDNNSFMANVAADPVAITFTPPPLATMNAFSTTTTTFNTNLTITGSNFSTNAANDLVQFQTATGTVTVPASTATSSSLTVAIPASAISGPVAVLVNGQPTAGIVLFITASATLLDQNVVSVSNGQTTSGINIYVPPPAGPPLSATQVSAVSVGSTNFTFTNSVILSRGQTYDLALSGVGMTQANGAAISFSGGGLTTSNVRYQTNGTSTTIIVTIAVDPNALVGPRNIGVKNANLDETILAGGIVIQ